MNPGETNELVLLPSLKAHRNSEGKLVLTQKYLDGVAEFSRSWPGPVTSLVRLSKEPGSDMDLASVPGEAQANGVEIRPAAPNDFARRVGTAATVLAHLSPFESETAAICNRIGVPIVFTSEYSPRTEYQIIDSTTRNPLLRIRRKLWVRQAEGKRRHILQHHAAGLQCSGTPTHDLYRTIAPDSLLFFDNRVHAADVVDEIALADKCASLLSGRPLRLVFGGRITAMKGVLDLPLVAQALVQRNVPFSMDIYGHGDLEGRLHRQIAARGLGDHVALHPAMDFRSGWVPLLKRNADLFVCCHPQGDPSSTYPEVMSCGVPIAGYDNEAFAGIVRESDAGWMAPMQDTEGLAGLIAGLHQDRAAMAEAVRRGREFALMHCFEETFARRVAHLVRSSRLPGLGRSSQ